MYCRTDNTPIQLNKWMNLYCSFKIQNKAEIKEYADFTSFIPKFALKIRVDSVRIQPFHKYLFHY